MDIAYAEEQKCIQIVYGIDTQRFVLIGLLTDRCQLNEFFQRRAQWKIAFNVFWFYMGHSKDSIFLD